MDFQIRWAFDVHMAGKHEKSQHHQAISSDLQPEISMTPIIE
jgi:hypothetical protein